MGVQRDEDFITEFIFVKLYNRSAAFREIIANKFNTTVNNISESIKFTGSNNKTTPENGCPDATGEDGKLYVEVKTRMSTPLTDFEKQDGAKHVKVNGKFKNYYKCTSNEKKGNKQYQYYGYKNFLNKDKEHKLLYVVCNDNYDLDNACKGKKGQVAHLYWTEILNFLKKTNSDDDLIKIIESRVEGLEEKEEISSSDMTAKLCKFSAALIKNKIIDSIEKDIEQEYDSEVLKSDSIWFGWWGSLNGFEKIDKISIGISIETGDAYLYVTSEAYKRKEKIIKIKFNSNETEKKHNKNNELYLKIFSLRDYHDFETDRELIQALNNYLNSISKIFSN